MGENVILGKPNCPYCDMAKNTLKQRGIPFRYVDLMVEGKAALESLGLTNIRTVPQIFMGGQHIGGYTDLVKHLQG